MQVPSIGNNAFTMFKMIGVIRTNSDLCQQIRNPECGKAMVHHFFPPKPKNEPVLAYSPDSEERKHLKKALDEILNHPPVEIPVVIGRKEIHTKERMTNVCPHDHKHVLASVSIANEDLVNAAINNALETKGQWMEMSFEDRSLIFLKAAELLSKKYRYRMNAATMLCLSKNVFQAEIDSACELIDFLRFNVDHAGSIVHGTTIFTGRTA